MIHKNMELIKKLIDTETNGHELVEISRYCNKKLTNMNNRLKCLFE